LRVNRYFVLVVAAALAGCATTPPPVALPAMPSPVALLPLSLDLPTTLAFDPFAGAGVELDPLPIPAGDLWEHIVRGYSIPEMQGPLVDKWEQWYADRPEYVARMIERSRRYLYHIVVEVELRGMPTDIALLPMVESAFNPIALSTARAAGIWQFMPSTGKDFGLTQNWWFDSRRDVVAATDSALDYLQRLHDEFEDWQLALAAYNWGEGNVRRAIARNQANGLPTDFASLTKVPDETRNYFPKLQAVKNIIADPQRYGAPIASVPDAPFFAVVKTTKKMDVKRAAELAELSMDEFVALNPQHNRPVIAGADEYAILLPIDRAEIFAAKLDLIDQPLVSWQAYRTKPGETLPQIATKFGMSVETLCAVNGIGSRARVPVGHALLVPSARPTVDTSIALAQTVFTTVPAGRTFYYTVRRGDTLPAIAARYDVTAQDMRRWNNLTQNALQVGQRLRVTTDQAVASRPSSKRAGGTKTTRSVASPAGKSEPTTPRGVPAKVAHKPVHTPAPAPMSARAAKAKPTAGDAHLVLSKGN
jgi:membrane-bound lytic murein transglycosylase D